MDINDVWIFTHPSKPLKNDLFVNCKSNSRNMSKRDNDNITNNVSKQDVVRTENLQPSAKPRAERAGSEPEKSQWLKLQ
ncbi:Hypothetical predicted protein [Octopus vulgaris]|uniref:Uncharacterized protein n=1 Tax=Octopus vulgaris TaxID=6645 RepID=A0AA36C1U5_OCTVU|nr:Hypothetical predicted protein [Octopus vulgaris]